MNEKENRVEVLRRHIQAARRQIPADLVLKNGRVVNVFSGEIQECDVAVYNGFIVGLGSDYSGREEVDLKGQWISPGFIDGHIHIESSMLLPSRLAAALLPHGTTTIVSDPHEIANVMGLDGIFLMMRDSQSIPFDIFFMAPSCVPATHLETSGAQLPATDLSRLIKEPRIIGLAEMMNFPGVLSGNPEILEKLILFEEKIIDGHAPALRGYDLQAYLSAGIGSDHETYDRDEAREKIRGGMMLMIREGSTARNLEELIPLINPKNARRCCLVSDDLHPGDILKRGHLDFILSKAVQLGLDPITALQMVTINPAEYFGLRHRGAVAPGFRADLVVLKDLVSFRVEQVYKDGRLIAEGGKIGAFPKRGEFHLGVKPLNIAPFVPERFRIRDQGREVRVIELIPGQIVTRMGYAKLGTDRGFLAPDIGKDILKLVVVERHKATGNIGLGFVKGFGIKAGALASTVAHDSHNVIAVGADDHDLWLAIEELRIMSGGMTVACNGKILARVPLEIAGLLSKESLDILTNQLEEVDRATSALGCPIDGPFMTLSFLALPVIPELKMTDMGLVDVNRFTLVPLFL